MSAKKKVEWRLHFIELLVVIIGISIAFTLEGWSSDRKQEKLQTNYLNSLKSDLEKDKEDFQSIIDSTNVILFEDPELTSALISCEQTSALDLPLKVMVWEENEDVYIGFIDPAFMRKRFMIQDCPEILQKMTGLMVRVVNEAIRQR